MSSILISNVEEGALYLLPPHVHYLEHDRTRNLQSKSYGNSWKQSGESDWRYDDDRLILKVALSSSSDLGNRSLRVSATAINDVQVKLCAFEFSSPSTKPPQFLNRFLEWGELHGEASLGDYSPLIVRWSDKNGRERTIRTFRGSISSQLRWQRQRLHLTITLDAAALHPRWHSFNGTQISKSAPTWSPGQTLSFELQISTGADERQIAPPLLSRFPAGAEAAFTLTDHSDFDTAGGLHVLLHGDRDDSGWLGRGLSLTKGVFQFSSKPPGRPPAASLQDQDYQELIHELHADGSEIAPHALNESGNIEPHKFRTGVRDFSLRWSSQTWIDHGNTLDYCYLTGGSDNHKYNLVRELQRNGINVLWSGQDRPSDACSSLNLLAPCASDLKDVVFRTLSHTLRGNVSIALHYLRSMLHWRMRGPFREKVSEILSLLRQLGMHYRHHSRLSEPELARAKRKLSRAIRKQKAPASSLEPYGRTELLNFSPVLYPERAVPLNQVTETEPVLFVTSEALHIRDVYTRGALNRLLDERGIHIGHCYLLNRAPYIAGIFRSDTDDPRLVSEWVTFLGALAESCSSGRLWNPTMAELAAWIRAMQHVSIETLDDNTLCLTNPLPTKIEGITLLLPTAIAPENVRWSNALPSGSRYWKGWLAVWGDVPARSRTSVSWGKSCKTKETSTPESLANEPVELALTQ